MKDNKTNSFWGDALGIFQFTVSMAMDVSKFLKEEKEDTDYIAVEKMLKSNL